MTGCPHDELRQISTITAETVWSRDPSGHHVPDEAISKVVGEDTRRELTILNWNIRHGGGTRRQKIVASVLDVAPDVAVLTEYRVAPDLLAALADAGYQHQATSDPPTRANGVAVVSRTPLTEKEPSARFPEWPAGRAIEVELLAARLHILAIYLPGSGSDGGPEVKAAFWEALHAAATSLSQKPALIVGDLNTGAHHIDETRATFFSAEAFVALERDLGWRDAFRLLHGDRREYTWWSRKKGGGLANGYRLDHFFVSPPLANAVAECSYIAEPREAGVSDHSMQIMRLRTDSTS